MGIERVAYASQDLVRLLATRQIVGRGTSSGCPFSRTPSRVTRSKITAVKYAARPLFFSFRDVRYIIIVVINNRRTNILAERQLLNPLYEFTNQTTRGLRKLCRLQNSDKSMSPWARHPPPRNTHSEQKGCVKYIQITFSIYEAT